MDEQMSSGSSPNRPAVEDPLQHIMATIRKAENAAYEKAALVVETLECRDSPGPLFNAGFGAGAQAAAVLIRELKS